MRLPLAQGWLGVVLVLAGSPVAHAWSCSGALQSLIAQISGQPDFLRIKAFALDIDDNILRIPTPIYVFHKVTGEEKIISTQTLAQVRQILGKPGSEWESWELRDGEETGSFRDFAGTNFLKYLRLAVKGRPDHEWQGPGWVAFEYAMRHPHTAAWTSLITSRRHPPEEILKGLQYLKSLGHIKYVPHVDNIFPVMADNFKPRFPGYFDHPLSDNSGFDPAGRKLLVMFYLLDEINARRVRWWMPKVLNREGTGFARLHTFGFSDDDLGTFQRTLTHLQEQVRLGRWPHLKLSLFFTGVNAQLPPQWLVIMSNGETRERLSREVYEYHLVVRSPVD